MQFYGMITIAILGAVTYVVTAYTIEAIAERVNYGKEVRVNRRLAGHIVTCRFNGSKRYFYVDSHSIIQTGEYFFTKDDARQACINKYLEQRPKSTSFARVA